MLQHFFSMKIITLDYLEKSICQYILLGNWGKLDIYSISTSIYLKYGETQIAIKINFLIHFRLNMN